ncbi:AcrR family transcriptional regulator [Elusimicrobium simillimum]|uniref:TetR/AcrR family transcriptional regulator n=1 Tax=Elusimicrobium simillimum TaxID=3143438 RepID=UPI003C6FCE3D
MARKSTALDEKLIKTALTLARKKGLNAISVREVCAKAKVNLGMFHYYFKNKENFDEQVLKRLYGSMIQNITTHTPPTAMPRENIKNILFEISAFARENKILLSALASDVMQGNKNILEFIAGHFTAHISMLFKEVARAAKKPEAAHLNTESIIMVLVMHIFMPRLMEGTFERLGMTVKLGIKERKPRVDAQEHDRIEFVINSIFK